MDDDQRSADNVVCPECGWQYPAGTVVVGGKIMDPLVESGGPSRHPSACALSENPSSSAGNSRGVFQQSRSTFGWDRRG